MASIRDADVDGGVTTAIPDPVPHIDEETDGERRRDRKGNSYPKRFWTAGPGTPQTKLVRTSTRISDKGKRVTKERALKPQYYAYVVHSEEEEQFLRSSAMRNKVWEEDLDEGEPSLYCEECNFSCRSLRAMNAHHAIHRKGVSRLGNIRPSNPNALI